MKVERIVREELSFEPCDRVFMLCGGVEMSGIITRIVENEHRSYVVIDVICLGDIVYTAWRPISTYGKTWWRANYDD